MPIPADEDAGDADRAMLADALEKARKLVDHIHRQQAELEASPPDLPPDKLAEGRRAFENAAASAQRMLKALEEAAASAANGNEPETEHRD